MTNQIEQIKDGKGNIIALIVRSSYQNTGTHFFTPHEFSQQMAFISREKGEEIKAHSHKAISQQITKTQETIFIRKGKVKIDLYDTEKKLVDSKILETGDVILLAEGGHGFEALDSLEMIEIKQGPYVDDSFKEIY